MRLIIYFHLVLRLTMSGAISLSQAAIRIHSIDRDKLPYLWGCLTVHLPHETMWNANLIQQGNFIDIFLARHVSGTYAHHQEH